MTLSHRPLGPLLLAALAMAGALLGGAGRASAGNPIPAVRAGQFAEADMAAAEYVDPIARKLVAYYRLLGGNANAREIAAFQAANQDWPNQGLLERRRQEAIAREPDEAAVREACAQGSIVLPGTLARCAEALADGGDAEAAASAARRAWVSSATPVTDAASFLAHWKSVLRPEDERARFDQLAWADNPEAAHQIARLAPADRPAALARLALRHDAPNAEELVDKLPAAQRDSPALVLERARWLRRAKREPDALALWKATGTRAEQEAPPERRAAFWAERNLLARRMLAMGDAGNAYALADDTAQTAPESSSEAAFLAGFIALRRTGDPAAAIAHFEALSAGKAAVTQARAHYWLARALAAQGKESGPDDAKAASFPLTFYGQLAARAAGADEVTLAQRIRAMSDPPFDTDAAWTFAGGELARAAVMLAAWGEFGRARAFLIRAQETQSDPAQQALPARLAVALGMPDTAVFIARRMGLEGLALPQAGWPEPVSPPAGPLDPAITLALIRQESSFDAGIVSNAGARGLMQLMPATADGEARRAGGSVSEAALTTDPARNMELGGSYMQAMLAAFDGSLPLAVAAYNAGPHRVEQWLHDNGDPRTGQIGMVDWIELIPFAETRNYVERVLENVVIYRARRDEPAGTLSAQWMR